MDSNLVLLFGRARAAVLDALFRAEDQGTALHLRELARRTHLSPNAVQYELRLLSQIGLVKDIGTESRPVYMANDQHVLHGDLHTIFTRSETGFVADEEHFARKRTRQREDRRNTPEANSPFLRRKS